MAVSLPQNLSLAVTTNITSTAPPLHMIQSTQWDPASVYGVVFGILTIVLAIPSTMLAFYAIKAHRRHQDEENASSSYSMNQLETGGDTAATDTRLGEQRLDNGDPDP